MLSQGSSIERGESREAAAYLGCIIPLPLPLRHRMGRLASGVCSAIGAKVLKARPFTVAKAAEACYLLTELEQQEAVVEMALKAAGDKVPKVAVAALDILCGAVG